MEKKYLEQIKKINERLAKYGECIDENILCSRAYLQGVLDRLVYDERRMTVEEACEIERLLDGVKDPFEESYNLSGDGRG